MHYEESSQAKKWQLSPAELSSLRERANRRVRDVLAREAEGGDGDGDATMGDAGAEGPSNPLAVYGFADTRGDRPKTASDYDGGAPLMQESDPNYGPTCTQASRGGHPLLTPSDEASLVTFYCSKIPLLVGPHAMLSSCRRAAKVAATACLLFRRFYLSNSVMAHDPKCMLAAAAFLATKVEDCMILVGYLEMGTKEMSAPVPINDILDAEIRLIEGIDFDLLVFSPYKTVLSYTEDLRTFLKTEKGRKLIAFPGEDGEKRKLVGEDLRPMHDAAMKICDDAIVSDLPMLFAPGEVGLASLMIANEYVNTDGEASSSGEGKTDSENSRSPQIEIMGYIRTRFQDTNEAEAKVDAAAIDAVANRVGKLGQMMRELKEGKHGCGNYEVDMAELKALNKKLKQCRAWGTQKKGSTKKKGRKRKAESEEA